MPGATLRTGGQRRRTHTEAHIPAEIVVARIVYWVFGVIEAIVAMRFALRLLGANPAAQFTKFVYQLSTALIAPFLAVFPTPRVQGAAFDWSALLAMAVYALVAWGIVALIYAARPREDVATLEESEHVDDSETEQRR
jgi:uncharacterized protein YggT (Ycf19 family)